MVKQALSGIRIIDWGMFVNGIGGSYMLGDLGAEVIHIEDRIRGDALRGAHTLYDRSTSVAGGRSLIFEMASRNKKSITLDITKEKGREIVYELVKKSDVFLTNFRQEVAARRGLDYETLSKYNPKLIYASASTYGFKGPLARKRGFDPLGLAYSGMMWLVGDRDQMEPLQPSGGIADQLGATMAAYGILAALVARERLGVGQQVEVSLLGSMMHLEAGPVTSALFTGRTAARHSRTRVRNPLSNMYKCADGRWLILSEPESNRFWSSFCQAIDKEELEKFDSEEKRRANCQEINHMLAEVFLTKTREEWLAILEQVQSGEMAFGPILEVTDLPDNEQVLENEYIVGFPDYPGMGDVKLIGFPIKLSETPCRIQSPAPEWGEHTEQVLIDICGYTWEEISRLREEEVI